MIANPRFYDRNRPTPWLEKRITLLLGQVDFTPVPWDYRVTQRTGKDYWANLKMASISSS